MQIRTRTLDRRENCSQKADEESTSDDPPFLLDPEQAGEPILVTFLEDTACQLHAEVAC